MTNTFNDGKIAKRLADKLDGQPITPVVIFAPDGTGWLQPVTGGAGGGGNAGDPDSAREATQQQLLAAVQALAPLLGNTDGIESLLSALSTNDQTVIGKLEAVRALLAGTLSVSPAAQTTVSSTLTIAAGTSISDGVNLTGRSLIRLTIGAAWTAADLTVQTSPDGATWYDLYDEYGTPYTIKAAASRTVFINPGPLLAVNFIRLRSGTPAAPVNQASAATITLSSVAL